MSDEELPALRASGTGTVCRCSKCGSTDFIVGEWSGTLWQPHGIGVVRKNDPNGEYVQERVTCAGPKCDTVHKNQATWNDGPGHPGTGANW